MVDEDFDQMASSLLNMSVSNAVTTKLSRTVTGGVASGHDVFSEDVGEKASKTAVCWDAFEHWWRQRTGDSQGAVPVLPESMVARLDELSEGTGADKNALFGSHFAFKTEHLPRQARDKHRKR